MTRYFSFRFVLCSLMFFALTTIVINAQVRPGRDPNQPIDEEYTKKIQSTRPSP